MNSRSDQDTRAPLSARGPVLKVYAASSWRNGRHSATVEALRGAGHEVYDFRNPAPGNHGFNWTQLDPKWASVTDPVTVKTMLRHPVANDAFWLDMDALEAADVCVLTLPCGRSAHLELGFAVGTGKSTAVLLDDESGPELMYGMVDALCLDLEELVGWLEGEAIRLVEPSRLDRLSDRELGAAITDPGDDSFAGGWG